MIIVTGTTGQVGGRAARTLAAQGVDLLQLVRETGLARAIPGIPVRSVRAFDDQAGLHAALEPGATVFLVSTFADHAERMRLHRGFVDAAAVVRIGHLVYLSFVGARPDAEFLHAQSHGETEEYIRNSGIPFTFLRTSYYHWALTGFFTGGVLCAPAGRVGWVSPDDCGRAVAGVLRSPAQGATFNLTGPEAPTFSEVVDQMNDLLGGPYRYVREEDIGKIPLAGVPDWAREYRRSSHRSFQVGEAAIVTDDVERLTDGPAIPLSAFISTHREAFPVMQPR